MHGIHKRTVSYQYLTNLLVIHFSRKVQRRVRVTTKRVCV